MKVWFAQIYIDAEASFPFSHHFQLRLSQEITALVEPSGKFIKKYGKEFELIFRVSAKKGIQENEIGGPTVFKKTKDFEYTVFLPFDVISRHADAPKQALKYLLKGACDVFDLLEIDKTTLLGKQESLIDGICSDPMMLAAPSWENAANETSVRKQFSSFFDKNRGT